jgi:hypothetical protein
MAELTTAQTTTTSRCAPQAQATLRAGRVVSQSSSSAIAAG